MTVVDVNTGKFTGSGGNLEETVTKNNLEAAEEIVRQLRLRDIGGIIVVDFIDMVLESNRDLVLRRLVECLGRDRTRHQVAEVTSLGLVQMTRKRIGTGLLEAFSEPCEHCGGRGLIVADAPIEPKKEGEPRRSRRSRGGKGKGDDANDSNGSNGSPAAGQVAVPQGRRRDGAHHTRTTTTSPAPTRRRSPTEDERPATTRPPSAEQPEQPSARGARAEPEAPREPEPPTSPHVEEPAVDERRRAGRREPPEAPSRGAARGAARGAGLDRSQGGRPGRDGAAPAGPQVRRPAAPAATVPAMTEVERSRRGRSPGRRRSRGARHLRHRAGQPAGRRARAREEAGLAQALSPAPQARAGQGPAGR